MNETLTVKPALLAGFQDMLPAKMIPFQRVITKIKQVYESFGFVPLETPGMERFDVLTGNAPTFNKSLFTTAIVKGVEDRGKELDQERSAMRFDLTVPLARVVAAYPEIPRPFKRYQIGKVWRGEKPQSNRYREFFQFDADIIGSHSILADTEIVQIIHTTLTMLDVPKFTIRVNDRRVLNGLAEVLECPHAYKELDQVIDKMGEIGVTGVINELKRPPESALAQKLILNDEQATKLEQFLTLKAASSSELLKQVEEFFGGKTNEGLAGISALRELSKILDRLNISDTFWKIDLSVARGLDYYTGPVFETTVDDMPEVGSIFSGGRFDGLVSRFIANSNMPGVGASIGVDRLMTVLSKSGKIEEKTSLTDVLVTVFSPTLATDSFLCAHRIRNAGVATETYLGQERTIRAQLGYALKQGIRFVIIIGPDEATSGKVTLRDLTSRNQAVLTEQEAIATICLALKK